MHFLTITDAPTLKRKNIYAAYAPYVYEMDIWFKYADKVTIISPTSYDRELLLSNFKKDLQVISTPSLNFTSFFNVLRSIIVFPIIIFRLISVMFKADHIHLRCPGNIGLLGCLIQVFFPSKIKTAKYAGNWNSKAKQPISYRFQKWLLANTLLTKNMTTLVYGNWQNQTRNIKPFFTATYTNSEIETPEVRNYTKALKFIFVGSLVKGKRPLLAIKIVEALHKKGKKVFLEVYGDGILNKELQKYIVNNELEEVVKLKGNRKRNVLKEIFKEAHFLILPSKSEGWPKAVAEAMFFGTIPIATPISCVPFMLDHGNRGILIKPNLELAVSNIEKELNDIDRLKKVSINASRWSQEYTLDTFEAEIIKLLKS
ncbi:glycosyltransferase family 4 protein [Flavivirga spongiicola]|uniref:Glycosyltransferase family 4 protein n=1 Tax=Flavivirga spongiicola TaxID=421621 RepID=A0ABU7XN83_9FLAO|nr:glycosyltransferase family 4 protein [Flavivirga sp. MEBiC05379]MDO5981679.1 glycosyltransferase family 4 protein [Flavivirga sp. MEBiC05379]